LDCDDGGGYVIFVFVHDKWQACSNVMVDFGLRWEYYSLFEGLEGKGSLVNYDPVTNTIRVFGYGSIDNVLNVKKNFRNFALWIGILWCSNERLVVRVGYGVSMISFFDNCYAFNYLVKQNYVGMVVNGFQC